MSEQDTFTMSGMGGNAANNNMAAAHQGEHRLGALESIAGELGLSSPIFPPTTFDVPDISFSNSVNNNGNGGSNGGMFGDSHSLFESAGQLMGELGMSAGHAGHSHQHEQQMKIQQSLQQIQQGMSQFPAAVTCSPSSGSDSDDLPLAQLAKRQAFGSAPNTAGSNTPTPESSTASHTSSPSDSGTNVTAAPSKATVTAASGSPVEVTSPAAAKKAKPSKRKKKKDPNEPQKPVSAYALFFRDTQATIKGHNPNASFGEVSKIVASMWDQLDPEHKDVYKKKTETAKKQYLKQLAAYRASQVSQSVSEDTEKSPSPTMPVVMSSQQMSMEGSHAMPHSSPTQPPPQQPMGGSGFVPGPIVSPQHMGPPLDEQQHQMHHHIQHQQQMMQLSPQHQMMAQQQQHMMQQQQQHMQHMQQQQHMMGSTDQMGSPTHHNMHPLQHHQSPPQEQQQHHSPPQHPNNPGNMYADFTGDANREMEIPSYPPCVRAGCANVARENPGWDSEYCSNECVVTHCRNIFTSWVGSRSAGSNTFPVK